MNLKQRKQSKAISHHPRRCHLSTMEGKGKLKGQGCDQPKGPKRDPTLLFNHVPYYCYCCCCCCCASGLEFAKTAKPTSIYLVYNIYIYIVVSLNSYPNGRPNCHPPLLLVPSSRGRPTRTKRLLHSSPFHCGLSPTPTFIPSSPDIPLF